MRAVRFHRHGGPDVLQLDEVAVPEPAAGQVLIQAEAIGANAIDTVLRRGNSPWDRPLPGTLTGDVVGRVVKLGPGNRFAFNYDYCKGCGVCVAECPCGAIEMVPEDV